MLSRLDLSLQQSVGFDNNVCSLISFQRYLTKHAYGNAETNDLWDAMTEVCFTVTAFKLFTLSFFSISVQYCLQRDPQYLML